MVKKTVALVLTTVLSFMLTAVGVAGEELPEFINPVIDQRTSGNCVAVSGEIDTDTANTTIIFRLTEVKETPNPENPEENIEVRTDKVVDFTTSFRDGDKIKFDFGTIYLPSNFETGEYVAEISGMNIKKYTAVFPYVVPSEMLTLLGNIESAAKSDTASVGAIIAEGLNAQKLALDISGYNSFKDNSSAIKAFECIMKAVDYQTPTSTEDGEGIDREKAKIAQAYINAVAAGKLMAIGEKEGISWENWYDSYYKLFGFDDESTAEESKRVTPYLTEVKDSENFVTRIGKANEYLNPDDISIDKIKEYLYQSALLSSIFTARSDSVVLEILNNFSDVYFTGMNLAQFNQSGTVEQGEVISNMRGQNFASCKVAVDKFNELVQEDTPSGSGGISGGSGGTGGGSKKTSQIAMPAVSQQKKEIFPDIASTEWAKEAIEYLYDKSIVSGNPDGTFAPNKNVTRAEFIKMVMEAMGVGNTSGENPFSDVDEDKWYADYLAKAYKEGIVQGDENGNVYPEKPITRQDMAVILYRAAKAEAKGDADFTDSDLISSYAKDAVGYFASAGIINGLGDGRFGPLEYATRAQTAVIIYRIITM